MQMQGRRSHERSTTTKSHHQMSWNIVRIVVTLLALIFIAIQLFSWALVGTPASLDDNFINNDKNKFLKPNVPLEKPAVQRDGNGASVKLLAPGLRSVLRPLKPDSRETNQGQVQNSNNRGAEGQVVQRRQIVAGSVGAARKVPENVKSSSQEEIEGNLKTNANYDVHIFYYPWYGNVETDGKFVHWNHEYLPHWDPATAKRYPKGKHSPPDDIGSNFYPALGPYSSRSQEVMRDHMEQIVSTGAGVLVVSWYPPGKADNQGIPSDSLIPDLLDVADEFGLRVAFHLEPYPGRDAAALRRSVRYLVDSYGGHPAFFARPAAAGQKSLPVYYVYDSYKNPDKDWARLLSPGGDMSIRGTKYDGIFICLVAERPHKKCVSDGKFDGFYTYFATNGMVYGSTWKNWPELTKFAKQQEALFVPSVGPGYVDTRVRPWNGQNTRPRRKGKYYEESWEAALAARPAAVSVTSFNEWHEGTQIERAVPRREGSFRYEDYSEAGGPDFYLKLTQRMVAKFTELQF